MGKTPRTRHSRAKGITDPIGTSNEAAELSQGLSSLEAKSPVIERLKSSDASEREIACYSLSNIVIEDATAIDVILKADVPRTLVQLLCDAEPGVVVAAAEALRSCSATPHNREALCDAIVKADCFTPLFNHLQTVKLLPEDSETVKASKDELLTHLVNIMVNLLEISDKAPLIIKVSSSVVPLVLQLLQPHLSSQRLMAAVAHFLNLLSESPECHELLHQNKNLLLVSSVNNYNNRLVRLLCASCVLNLASSEADVLAFLKVATPNLVESLTSFDAIVALNQLNGLQSQIDSVQHPPEQISPEAVMNDAMNSGDAVAAEPVAVPQENTPDPMLPLYKQFDELTELWRVQTEAQAVALEIVTNVLSGADPEELGEEFMEMDETMNDQNACEELVSTPVLTAIVSAGLIKLAVEKAKFPPSLTFSSGFDPDLLQEFHSLLLTVQLRALTCLQNLSLVLGSYATVYPQDYERDVHIFWQTVYDVFTNTLTNLNNNVDMQIQFLQSCTTSMLHILRHNVSRGGSIDIATHHLEAITNVAKTCTDEQVRSNCIGIVGVLAQHPRLTQYIETFGRLLLDALSDPSPWVYSEALNAIFDVFAETQYNAIVSSIGMMQRLEQFVPFLNKQIEEGKKQKARRVLLDRLDETRINLRRFIKYKQQQ